MWIHLQNLKGSEILTAKITVLSQKSLNPIAGLTASQEMRSEKMTKYFDTETKGERAVVIAMIIGAVIAASILMMLPPVPMV